MKFLIYNLKPTTMKPAAITFICLVTLCFISTHARSQSFDTYPPIPGALSSTIMNDVGFDNAGRTWINTAGIGVAVYDSATVSWWMLNAGNGLVSDSTTCISFNGSESWIGTINGAVRYSGYPTQGGSVVNSYSTPQLPGNM